MVKFGIGQAVSRVEDPRLLMGRGTYTADVSLPNQAHGVVVRSPHAHAKFTNVDVASAATAPGVLLVLTVTDADTDGLGDIPCRAALKNRDGTPRADTPRPVLARQRVRHVGDAVAFVVAESEQQARDAAELVDVDYQALPVATDTVGAAQPGAPQIWDHITGNLCFDWESGDRAAVEAAIAKAAHVTRLEITNNRVVVNAMEPRAALGDYDAERDRLILHTPSQGTHSLRAQLAEQIFKVETQRVRVCTSDVGGGFGMKIFLYPEQCLVVWAARRLGRPVKWVGDRQESFLSDTQGRDNVTHGELAMDDEGRFLALKATTYANLGAYLSNFGPFIPTAAGTNMLAGLYRTPAIHVRVKGVVTNTVPVDAYRGAGRPEAAYVVERLVDAAAREIGLSPDEIRRRNFVETFPYRTALGDIYDSGDFAGCMRACMARADWAGFDARRAEAEARGKLRGIGMATYIERCGGGGTETAQITFGDNDTVTIVIGNQSNGQGHETLYTQILSVRLGIPAASIRVVQGDSDATPSGFTGGSRAASVGGTAVDGVAAKIIDKGLLFAGQMMETAVADIEFADGIFTVAGTDRSLSLFEIVRAANDPANLPAGATPGLNDAHEYGPKSDTFPNGCHICELEVDPDTGAVTITRYSVVDDFGAAINPLLIAGQVHGGIVQGIGQALYEHTVYDGDSGQLLTGSFMDYAMPHADDIPEVDFSMRNVPCTTNPMGVKGAGEAGAIGAPPTVINALVDAIHRKSGLTHIDMPATPLAIWLSLQPRLPV